MKALALACIAALSFALWLTAARQWLGDSGWPRPPYDPEAMNLDAILLIYGHVPRGIVALLAGAVLGLSGALLQAVLRNPIADPSTLGISSGAQLALVAATILAPEWLGWGRWPIAMAGAGIALALVMAVGAARDFHPITMVIAGMLIGLFTSSLATAITLSEGEYLYSLVVWNGGSLVQTNWGPALSLAGVLAAGGLGAALLSRPLSALGIDGAGARALGLNVAQIRALAAILAAGLAAGVAAAVGLVAFVGLAAPALARALGARTQGQILALSPLTGGLLLSLCDGMVLSVTGAGGEMFPTGAVTGLIGGPLLLWLLPRLRAAAPPAQAERLPRLARPARTLFAMTAFGLALAVAVLAIGRLPGGWTILDAQSLEMFLPNRFPRLAGAAAAGGLLALAGALLQRLTANPLASPEVLGVSGGAAIGYAGILFLVTAPSAPGLIAGAAAGGIVALAIVSGYVAGRDARAERLLLAGIAVSSLAAALLSVLMAAGTQQSFAVLSWLSGSATRVTMTGAAILWGVLAALLLAGLALQRWLTILPLGPAVGHGLGLPVTAASLGVVGTAGLATGAATILVGPLSFVGLMAPHMARWIGFARAGDHVLGSVLIGAVLMLAADFGARMATFPYDLPLGLFASLLGTPWLVWLMIRKPA